MEEQNPSAVCASFPVLFLLLRNQTNARGTSPGCSLGWKGHFVGWETGREGGHSAGPGMQRWAGLMQFRVEGTFCWVGEAGTGGMHRWVGELLRGGGEHGTGQGRVQCRA